MAQCPFILFMTKLNNKPKMVFKGFVDLSKVQQAIQPNAEYYICGPGAFIKKHFDYLSAQGVSPDAIHFEEFGPATLAVG